MKIVVCYKNVPDSELIRAAADGALDFSDAAPVIGQYDLNAMEAAAALAGRDADTEIIALTVDSGVIDNSKQKKAILSRGASRMTGVRVGPDDSTDAYFVAEAIAGAVKKEGGVDIVLFGEGSADMYARQTGPMTGALLGWPNVNAVSAIEPDVGALIVKRSLEESCETLRVSLPAVLSVTADINRPRIPSMKDILSAGRKPAGILDAADVKTDGRLGAETVSILAPKTKQRMKKIYETASDAALDDVAAEIRKQM